MKAKIRHDSISKESALASILSIVYFFFVMKCYRAFRLFSEWIVSKLSVVDTVSNEGVHNIEVVTGGSMVIVFFGMLLCLIFTHFQFKKHKVSRPNNVFCFFKTVLTMMSVYLITLIVHLSLALGFISGVILATYGVEVMPISIGWILAIGSIFMYGVAAIVGANCLFEQSEKKLITAFGIGEGIYKHWRETMEYRYQLWNKRTIIASYKTQNQYI